MEKLKQFWTNTVKPSLINIKDGFMTLSTTNKVIVGAVIIIVLMIIF